MDSHRTDSSAVSTRILVKLDVAAKVVMGL